MSAVKTGMPAWLASRIAGPMAFESQGVRTIAATFRTMKSFTWFCCFATSNSPLTASSPVAGVASRITPPCASTRIPQPPGFARHERRGAVVGPGLDPLARGAGEDALGDDRPPPVREDLDRGPVDQRLEAQAAAVERQGTAVPAREVGMEADVPGEAPVHEQRAGADVVADDRLLAVALPDLEAESGGGTGGQHGPH